MKDLWTYLASADKPIIIYGMGNGADKILSVFDTYNIKPQGIFASDGFVRPGKTFHGFEVESYSQISKRFADFIVLVSFATSLPEVIDNIKKIASERELYAPAVPVYGDVLFNYEYYTENKEEIEKTKKLFSDEESVRIFEDVINYRLTGNIDYLFDACSDKEKVWREILSPDRYTAFLDCGAYTGDTAAEFLARCPKATKVWALEPDAKNFTRLQKAALCEPRITAVNKGAWDRLEEVDFRPGAGRGAGAGKSKKTVSLCFDAPDNIIGNESVDYIKYDVEGAEAKALKGSQKLIERYSPDMLVSLYHRTEDIFTLPQLLYKMNPSYRFYLRRFTYIPDWDLNLYAISGK